MVYDCDSEAKKLMEADEGIKSRIREEISPDVTDGRSEINRTILASIVFKDEGKRRVLNSIVHGAVRENLKARFDSCRADVMFVESAIMAESGLAEMCHSIWIVDADRNVRISRVMNREHCDAAAVESRMSSQQKEQELLKEYSGKCRIIVNDDSRSLLNQLEELIDREV